MSPASNTTGTSELPTHQHHQSSDLNTLATPNHPDIEGSEIIPRSRQHSLEEAESLTLSQTLCPPKVLVSENSSVQTLLSTKVTAL